MGHKKTPPDGITCDPGEDIDVRCSLPSWAQSYSFSGNLRPTLLSPKRTVPPSIRRPDYAVSFRFFNVFLSHIQRILNVPPV